MHLLFIRNDLTAAAAALEEMTNQAELTKIFWKLQSRQNFNGKSAWVFTALNHNV